MKKYYLPLCSFLFLILFSGCTKRDAIPPPATSTAPAVVKTTTGIPKGGTDGSGVDPTTGYTILTKHYLRDANGNFLYDANWNLIWDGTYDAPYYNVTLNITITGYKLNPVPGDPVFGEFTTPPGTGTSVSSDGYGTFTLTVIQWIVTNYFSHSTLTDFDNSVRAFFNGQTATYPMPGPYIAGTSIQTRYGKLIEISPGVYAVAELLWAPTPPPCDALCQFCILHPNDPSCP